MNRMTNKYHCDLRHRSKMDEPLFDRLGTGMQCVFLVGIILTVPLWFPLWILNELKKA